MDVRGSPTIETLALLGVVYLGQQVLLWIGLTGSLALDASVAVRPWALVTSVYAHAGPRHLLVNAVALAVVGPLFARHTTRTRFHAYFLSTGVLAGLAEVFLGGLVGPSPSVVGASGAIFAMLGYLLSGNVVSAWLLDRLSLPLRVQLALFFTVAVLITLATATPRSALLGHAAGLTIGLVAGRLRLVSG